MSARSPRVSIPGALSDSLPFDWDVPEGSCLGPLLHIIYSSKLFNIIQRHLPNSYCYADDSEIYLSFNFNKIRRFNKHFRSLNAVPKENM